MHLEGVFLPESCVRQIAAYLVNDETTPGCVLLNVVAMAGVCRQWRHVTAELPSGSSLTFDSLDSQAFSARVVSQPKLVRFRKSKAECKRALFSGAATWLTGYTGVVFSGDAVTDELLLSAGSRNGSALVSVCVKSASGVTDQGLAALISCAPRLESLHLECLGSGVSGAFLPAALLSCPRLQRLHISGVPGMQWGSLRLPACISSRGGGAAAPPPQPAAPWACAQLQHLHLRSVNLESFGVEDEEDGAARQEVAKVLGHLPDLATLEVDGPARIVRTAAVHCPKLVRLSYLVSSKRLMDEVLWALNHMASLQQLELVVRNFVVTHDQLRILGMLPMQELRVDSYAYQQQPTMSRPQHSHLDNDGVKALVDSIRTRYKESHSPLKLSLCGATALTHEAVSALLSLPILTELDLGGCCKITSMDKMRLVAKVKAGRQKLLEMQR